MTRNQSSGGTRTGPVDQASNTTGHARSKGKRGSARLAGIAGGVVRVGEGGKLLAVIETIPIGIVVGGIQPVQGL